jgi:hypothetical protein
MKKKFFNITICTWFIHMYVGHDDYERQFTNY